MSTNMNRRDAIKTISIGSAAILAAPLFSRADEASAAIPALAYPYVLPPLPYLYDALESFIDAETMTIHHTRHHAAYIKNLNAALDGQPEWQAKPLQDLLTSLDALPDSIRATVRNNGGGHANHDLFWRILTPQAGGKPEGRLGELINASFGSLESCLEQLKKASMSVFGSGWSWISYADGALSIESTPNQDTPIMHGRIPVVGIDVWEHAYYLRYQNKRADYVDSVLSHINWAQAARALPA